MANDLSTSVQTSPPRRGIRIAMFVVLGVLLALLATPLVAYRISLAWYQGKMESEAKVARQELGDINLADFGRVSRLVAKAVGPSVVSIQTSGQQHYADERQFYSGQPQHPGHELSGQGSGVVVDQDGYILTNWHVVAGATDINVHLNGGTPHRAALIGVDVEMDLALLQIDQQNLTPLPWGDSNEVEVGDPVWAVGSPFGLDNTVTFGIISGKGRRASGMASSQLLLQTSAAINPGNSGGPLVNIRGELVGINTAILAAPNTGIGFAIPSDAARKVYERLKDERPQRPPGNGFLGVALRPLTQELADQLQLPPGQKGALVARVVPNSPAAEAGLAAGDLIVGFKRREIVEPTMLSLLIAATHPNAEVKLTVIRHGKQVVVPVTIGEQPK